MSGKVSVNKEGRGSRRIHSWVARWIDEDYYYFLGCNGILIAWERFVPPRHQPAWSLRHLSVINDPERRFELFHRMKPIPQKYGINGAVLRCVLQPLLEKQGYPYPGAE